MKMSGMTARSDSLSAVSCEASLVKMRHGVNSCVLRFARTSKRASQHTFSSQCEQGLLHNRDGAKGLTFLVFGVELAHPRDDVARQADTDNLHDGLEDQQRQVREVGVRAVLVLEGVHEAIAAVVVGVRAHGDEAGRGELELAQAQGLRAGEERHLAAFVERRCGRCGSAGGVVKRAASCFES
jgi:hypothetical protein